jgi:hypothetical protein
MRNPIRLFSCLLVLAASARVATAAPIPPFSQTFTHPTGLTSTSALGYNTGTLDTSITFQPLVPPDNDWGVDPITSSLHFSGSTLNWALSLDMQGTFLRRHDYSPTNQCNAVFRLYGVGLGDTAFVTVRVISTVAFVRAGPAWLGLSRGRVALTTNLGNAAHEVTHFHGEPLFTVKDTLDVPARVLGNDQFLTFQLTTIAHVEELDGGNPRVDVGAVVSFLDVPPGMSVVNAHGYGDVVLDVPAGPRPAALTARVHADGRRVRLAGVAPGIAKIALYDVSGRRIVDASARAPASGDVELGLPEPLTSGVYFVRCLDARGARSTRFALAR